MNAAKKSKRKQQQKVEWIDPGMKKPLIFSAMLHLAVMIFATLGLPYFVVTEPELKEIAITVDLAELSEVSETNVVDKPNETEKPAPEPPKPVEQKPVYKQEEPEPEPEQPVPDDLLTPRKPEVEEVPEPPKPEDIKPEEVAKIKNPPKPTNKPKPPKPKPEKPKEEPKEEPKVQEKDFSSLLKSLAPDQEEAPKPTQAPPTETMSEGQVSQIAHFGENFTRSEEDDLNRGVQPCWNVNAGGKFAENLIVSLTVYVNPDMTVKEVDVMDDLRYSSDPHFRASADAARRALLNPTCRTLRLPPEKYEQWKVFQYDFDPSMML